MQNKSSYICSYICLTSSKTYFGTRAAVASEKVIRAISGNTFVLVGDHLDKRSPQSELSFFLLWLHHKAGMNTDQTKCVFYFFIFFFPPFHPYFLLYFFLFWRQCDKSRYYTFLCWYLLSLHPGFVAASHGHLHSNLFPFSFWFASFSVFL